MLKYRITVAAAACAALLAGAGLAQAASPEDETLFLDTARHYSPSLLWQSDEGLLDVGYAMCEVFDSRGVSPDVLRKVIGFGTEGGFTEPETRNLMGAATRGLCPQHGDALMIAFGEMVEGR
ncbi:DUF732 domain-containing protein [Nocardia asteroides]|uniref:DUF732 domain-containing protein n=1 Tax=Nocardia asteroides NBRC 15531 TaxID=1110697 RepID=U5ELU4_NOCAS|nr:DUF732 domain-containing protein [Nocardia asteroides]TLF63552.1 DUF732 domain-containing protein [Nocardia asteroides NBRC 15531]UGT47000.1 DUF732 domain-containing protein [Nocardia asteroides]SFM82620.1 Protein of unknown function [Nocardia asteroides]VEG34133.1 Protein of uncharacterised function (DUF732) [Nocardia asteroides]GAD87293.1 hypothetical protein NCAST_34_04230 [Nocardia asteroides NBRC 15531]